MKSKKEEFNEVVLLESNPDKYLSKSCFFKYKMANGEGKIVPTRGIKRYNLVYMDYESSNGIQHISSEDGTGEKYCMYLHNHKFKSLTKLSSKEESGFTPKENALVREGWLLFLWENYDTNFGMHDGEFHIILATVKRGKIVSVYLEGYDVDINRFNSIIYEVFPEVMAASKLIGISDKHADEKDS